MDIFLAVYNYLIFTIIQIMVFATILFMPGLTNTRLIFTFYDDGKTIILSTVDKCLMSILAVSYI